MVVDISPRNSGAIYGFTAGLSSFPGPLAPYFVGYVLELGVSILGIQICRLINVCSLLPFSFITRMAIRRCGTTFSTLVAVST